MKCLLPQHLNPRRFRALDVYSDEYDNWYSISGGRHDFIIDNEIPFRLWFAEGINGEDVEERLRIIQILRVAAAIYRRCGIWPELRTDWNDMCPGAVLRLDISALIESPNSELPEILSQVSARLDLCLESKVPFGQAENHYRDELAGLSAFNPALGVMQSQFDAQPVRTLSVSTKARRLKYLSALAGIATQVNEPKLLNSELSKWATAHREELLSYQDPKGIIDESAGPISAKPYLDLARFLSIVVPVGRGLVLSNTGAALILLLGSSGDFSLSLHEQLFFLFELLEHDRDIIGPLLRTLNSFGSKTKRELRKAFPEIYKTHLEVLLGITGTAHSRRVVEDAIERIVDPRVSWLVDLGICDLSKDQVSLTEDGRNLARSLQYIEDSGMFILTADYLRRRFFKRIAPWLKKVDTASPPNRQIVIEWMIECIETVRKATKSLASDRIVASTFFHYTAITFYVKHRIPVEHWELQTFLQRAENAKELGWELRWSASQGDGYLQRISITH